MNRSKKLLAQVPQSKLVTYNQKTTCFTSWQVLCKVYLKVITVILHGEFIVYATPLYWKSCDDFKIVLLIQNPCPITIVWVKLLVGQGHNLNIEPAPSECLWRFHSVNPPLISGGKEILEFSEAEAGEEFFRGEIQFFWIRQGRDSK